MSRRLHACSLMCSDVTWDHHYSLTCTVQECSACLDMHAHDCPTSHKRMRGGWVQVCWGGWEGTDLQGHCRGRRPRWQWQAGYAGASRALATCCPEILRSWRARGSCEHLGTCWPPPRHPAWSLSEAGWHPWVCPGHCSDHGRCPWRLPPAW